MDANEDAKSHLQQWFLSRFADRTLEIEARLGAPTPEGFKPGLSNARFEAVSGLLGGKFALPRSDSESVDVLFGGGWVKKRKKTKKMQSFWCDFQSFRRILVFFFVFLYGL
jgi:hypothetical protein